MAHAQASYAPPGSLVSYRPLAPASLDRVFFSSRRLSDLGERTQNSVSNDLALPNATSDLPKPTAALQTQNDNRLSRLG